MLVTPSIGGAAVGEAPQPLTVPASGRVTLQEAIGSVRRFAGEPGLVLEGGLQADDAGSRRADLYYLERVSPTRGEDLFKVDARTAEVVEATFRGRMAPAGDAVDLTLADAEALAARFARTHFWGFDQLALVDRSARTSESGTTYSFRWSQLSRESGAELPVSVSVAVMSRSGQVFWYLGQRDQLQIDPRPAVERARAVEITRAWLLPRDQRWDLDQPSSVRLQVLYDDDDRAAARVERPVPRPAGGAALDDALAGRRANGRDHPGRLVGQPRVRRRTRVGLRRRLLAPPRACPLRPPVRLDLPARAGSASDRGAAS